MIPVLGSSMAGTLRQRFLYELSNSSSSWGKEIIPAVGIDADVRLLLDICEFDEF